VQGFGLNLPGKGATCVVINMAVKEYTVLICDFVFIGNLLQIFRWTLLPLSLGQSRNYPNSEDGGSTPLRNVGKRLSVSTASYPWKL
jgi:hypothetical protein